MRIGIVATLSALVLGLAAQVAHAGGDYSNAMAYALSSSGVIEGRLLCGGADLGGPGPSCDAAWRQVDSDSNVKFIQAGGNMFFEVYATGQIWIRVDPFGTPFWINAGIDPGLTSPTQLTVGRNSVNLPGQINIYKATGGKLFKWLSGSSWQELTAFSAKGVVAVSGDYVTTKTPGTGLYTVYHISSGAPTTPVIDRQYGPIVGTVDSFVGGSSSAYLARFVAGTTTNQETVTTTSNFFPSNTQYGPAFTFTDIKGLAIGSKDGYNDVFMLLPRSTTYGDNNVLMVSESGSSSSNNPGVVVRGGLSAGIAAATSYEVFGAGMRSYLWVLKPNTASGDVFEYKCTGTSCSFVTEPAPSLRPYVQVVAATNWVPGDPDE